MNAQIFAKWMERQGYKVVKTQSTYWYEAGRRVFQAFPFHWVIRPSDDELMAMLLKHNAAALRFSTPIGNTRGLPSYHIVCNDHNYDLTGLPRQARQNVKRGLKHAEVERIEFSRLAAEGWRLRKDTLIRQGRSRAETETWWRRLCLAAKGLEGFEAWAAVSNGQLSAAFLAFQCDDYYTLPYAQSATEHIGTRVNNAMFYQVTRTALNRPGISSVFYGLHSLDAPASVDQFKFRMGYQAKPVRQQVVFHPCLNPMVNKVSHAVIERLLKRFQGNYFLAKTEGMLRFCLEGKRSINQQDATETVAMLIGRHEYLLN